MYNNNSESVIVLFTMITFVCISTNCPNIVFVLFHRSRILKSVHGMFQNCFYIELSQIYLFITEKWMAQ